MVNNNVDWRKVLVKIAGNISTELNLNILVEDFILQEISDRIDNSLDHIEFENPNVAKIAGIVVFWVRKLKPFYYDFDEAAKSGKLHPLNELIAIQTGLAICSQYKDDCSLLDDIRLSDRVLKDWLHSLRYHSHSPYSSILAFELLTTTDEDLKQQGVKLMLTKEDMDMVHDAIRLSLIARKDELKLSDEKLGKQAFGYMTAPRGKIQSLFVGQGAPGKRKPQTINICELVNLCEAMGLSWQDEIRKALRQLKQ